MFPTPCGGPPAYWLVAAAAAAVASKEVDGGVAAGVGRTEHLRGQGPATDRRPLPEARALEAEETAESSTTSMAAPPNEDPCTLYGGVSEQGGDGEMCCPAYCGNHCGASDCHMLGQGCCAATFSADLVCSSTQGPPCFKQGTTTLAMTEASVAPELDVRPGAMQWVLSVILVTLLCGHLMRIGRVLRGENPRVVQRSAPDGMRTVQCGHCQRMQYLQTHIRIFVCCNCHSTNRLTVDPIRQSHQTPVLELIESTGPCKKYEFRRQGELLWQMLKEEIDEGTNATSRAAGQQASVSESEGGREDAGSGPADRSSEGEHDNAELPTQDAQAVAERQQGAPRESDLRVLDIDEAAAEVGFHEAGAAVGSVSLAREGSKRGDSHRTTTTNQQGDWEACGVCWDQPGCMVLLPCSHGNVCQECATRIAQNRASGGAHCPHCRADITMLVRLTEVNGELARGVEHRVPIARVMGSHHT